MVLCHACSPQSISSGYKNLKTRSIAQGVVPVIRKFLPACNRVGAIIQSACVLFLFLILSGLVNHLSAAGIQDPGGGAKKWVGGTTAPPWKPGGGSPPSPTGGGGAS